MIKETETISEEKLTCFLDYAIHIASTAHLNQKDKANMPYILHPLRVMFDVNTLEQKIAAVLHDAIEDTTLTLSNLKDGSLPDNIVYTIDCLSKRPNESYKSYITRVKTDNDAIIVKLADLKDNLDLTRIKNPTEKDFKRCEKYTAIYAELEQYLTELENGK